MNTNQQNIELIKACLKGTQSSFKTLYNEFKGYVYTICVRYGVAEHEVKDYMQIIFSEVFKSLSKYDPQKAQFKTWLSRITINQILQQKRKRKINYVEIDDASNSLIDSNHLEHIDIRIDENKIHEVLSKMPEKYISVFNLYIVDGYSHKEISKKLNIPENTSRTLLHRGRIWAIKMLKQHLGDNLMQFKNVL